MIMRKKLSSMGNFFISNIKTKNESFLNYFRSETFHLNKRVYWLFQLLKEFI